MSNKDKGNENKKSRAAALETVKAMRGREFDKLTPKEREALLLALLQWFGFIGADGKLR